MSLFLALPILAATGIYKPQVVDRHGHCLAEPGTSRALLSGTRGTRGTSSSSAR
jgi:hypothetical protein